jgi:hypothetical protein
VLGFLALPELSARDTRGEAIIVPFSFVVFSDGDFVLHIHEVSEGFVVADPLVLSHQVFLATMAIPTRSLRCNGCAPMRRHSGVIPRG